MSLNKEQMTEHRRALHDELAVLRTVTHALRGPVASNLAVELHQVRADALARIGLLLRAMYPGSSATARAARAARACERATEMEIQANMDDYAGDL